MFLAAYREKYRIKRDIDAAWDSCIDSVKSVIHDM